MITIVSKQTISGPISQWINPCLIFCSPGFESQVHLLWVLFGTLIENFYWENKSMKINKKYND